MLLPTSTLKGPEMVKAPERATVMKTAEQAAAEQMTVLRGGIFRPS